MSKDPWRTTQLKVPPRQVHALVCALEGRFAKPDSPDHEALQECFERGWLEVDASGIRLTQEGNYLARACVALIKRRISGFT